MTAGAQNAGHRDAVDVSPQEVVNPGANGEKSTMAHDHQHGHDHGHGHDHDHRHDHGHDHDHDHGHHHHDHGHDHDRHPADAHHDWHSKLYVADWIARDDSRMDKRQPLLDRMVAAVPFAANADIAVLDIGGGSGVVSNVVLRKFPRARVTLQDFSAPMLDRATQNFAGRLDTAFEQKVGGPFHLAVSGIAIHNLHDMAAIAACYQSVRRVLKDRGVFINYDHLDHVGGVPLNQHMLKVAGFANVETIWHEFPSAILKAQA